jgi:hypothetical protein
VVGVADESESESEKESIGDRGASGDNSSCIEDDFFSQYHSVRWKKKKKKKKKKG